MQVLVTVQAATPDLDRAADVVRGPIGSAPGAVGMLVGPTERVAKEQLDLMPELRVLAVAGAGTDAVDVAALSDRGIHLVNAPDSTADPTAELTMCLALMVSRGVQRAMAELSTGIWGGWSYSQTTGRSLDGLTLGLVGYGRIGQRVAALAGVFGMDVIHHTRRTTGLNGYIADLSTLLSRADVVSLHVPLTLDTDGFIDEDAFARMRPGSAIVNTSRGGIIDESALIAALLDGHLSGAALDVFAAEPSIPSDLLEVPNLVVTPHIGTATSSARAAMVQEASAALLHVLFHDTSRNGPN